MDQLSSADIAVNVADMTNLPEKTSVNNHADTVNALLAISPTDQTIISKPLVVATSFKSNKDITKYVTKPGDTVSKLASKFHVTSDSILSSNGLTGDQLATGVTLYIPPVNGIVYVVKSGDTAASLADKFNANKDQIIAYNDAEIGGLRVGERIIIPDGTITATGSGFTGPVISGGFIPAFSSAFNGYDYGWCTWWAAFRRNQLGHPVPSNLGDAYTWFILAQRANLPTGYKPQPGAVMVELNADHVAVVEQVNPDGSFWVSEMNDYGQKAINDPTPWGGWNVRDFRLIKSPAGLGFIY